MIVVRPLMQIMDDKADQTSLASIGVEAVQLLGSGDFLALADRFGYAVALGREPATAIQEDFWSCLAQLGSMGLALGSQCPVATVTYFEPGDSGLLAVVECLAPTDNGAELLVELVVTANGPDKHVSLEQLSVAA